MATIGDRLVPVDAMYVYDPQVSHEEYRNFGYGFGLYLREHYWDRAYAQFGLEHGRNWRLDWSDVIDEVVAVEGDDLQSQWRALLNERYSAQSQSIQAQGEIVGEPIGGPIKGSLTANAPSPSNTGHPADLQPPPAPMEATSSRGDRVARISLGDGRHNIAVRNNQGDVSDGGREFPGGSWIQSIDWAPDGEVLVFTGHLNLQHNVFVMEPDGTGLQPITISPWVERDAHWSQHDGRIYFAADPGGIYNVYAYDPQDDTFSQITNVIGAAYHPRTNEAGDLVYTQLTPAGWQDHLLRRESFYNRPSGGLFERDPNPAATQRWLEYEESFSDTNNHPRPYKATKSLDSPSVVPQYILTSNEEHSLSITGGIRSTIRDALEIHVLDTTLTLGEHSAIRGEYTFSGWRPDILIDVGHYRDRYTQTGRVLTPQGHQGGDQITKRRSTLYNIGRLAFSISKTPLHSASLDFEGVDLRSQDGDRPKYDQTMRWGSIGAQHHLDSHSVNRHDRPVYRHTIQGRHVRGQVTDSTTGGILVNDGEAFENYEFNEVLYASTSQHEISPMGPIFGNASDRGDSIMVSSTVGMIDRNVPTIHEFHAGGLNPLDATYGPVVNNYWFPGYPPGSIVGESLLVLQATYQIPIEPPVSHSRWGPFTNRGMKFGFGGTMGNAWSYAAQPSDGFDTLETLDREVPFVNQASSNGHRVLSDAYMQARVHSGYGQTLVWDTFIGLAYALTPITDVASWPSHGLFESADQGANIQWDTHEQPKRYRIYFGIGSSR